MTGDDAGPLPVFVYGTLRPGQPGFDELNLSGRVDRIGPDRVAGTLYDLGDYPGALLPTAPLQGTGWIVGELLMPRDADVLALLDAFELYDPASPDDSEYLRLPVITEGRVSAWIYTYNFPIHPSRAIPSGDWTNRPAHPGHGPSAG
ncbi:gamma-glutamylcyclotransferase [Sphingobium sufflavum]|uniref:gamma-glutamylcyclotransferase family protein n=1 Tax=Sphingobium sufflavum TaxID=1129547 RepID=UPI001F287914|nr:gamma-glutamylcyclotransferase family protein [Sphingobium sufflavum]MCE7797965.1 gamma-glutamylcyclotransferase [Sphingobium sufflavum]